MPRTNNELLAMLDAELSDRQWDAYLSLQQAKRDLDYAAACEMQTEKRIWQAAREIIRAHRLPPEVDR